MLDRTNHPCFDDSARHRYARVHLPVAPRCNIQCNFCDRKMDCLNESRPGVTSSVLSPGQALYYLEQVVLEVEDLSVVGIAGPGDPFAQPEATLETLSRVRERFPEMLLCVASNGLRVAEHAARLAELGTSHVTITMNALSPEVGEKIYAWVRVGRRIYRGGEASEVLIRAQAAAVRALAEHGVTVKVNTILIPGVNDREIPKIAARAKELGAALHNVMPLYPVKGTPLGEIAQAPTPAQMKIVRAESAHHLPQMSHCSRCRADAVGRLGQQTKEADMLRLQRAATLSLEPGQHRPYIAVATREGVLVNEHLGEATQLWVYESTEKGPRLVETRSVPPTGGQRNRWLELASRFRDCRIILTGGAGGTPRAVLSQSGIDVMVADALIDDALRQLFAGEPLRAPYRETRCGDGCSGTGAGCG